MSYNDDFEQVRSRKQKTTKKHVKGNRNFSYDDEDLMEMGRKDWKQYSKNFC